MQYRGKASKISKLRKIGFLSRMSTQDGRNVIKRRRLRKRVNLTVSDVYRKMMKKPKHTLR